MTDKTMEQKFNDLQLAIQAEIVRKFNEWAKDPTQPLPDGFAYVRGTKGNYLELNQQQKIIKTENTDAGWIINIPSYDEQTEDTPKVTFEEDGCDLVRTANYDDYPRFVFPNPANFDKMTYTDDGFYRMIGHLQEKGHNSIGVRKPAIISKTGCTKGDGILDLIEIDPANGFAAKMAAAKQAQDAELTAKNGRNAAKREAFKNLVSLNKKISDSTMEMPQTAEYAKRIEENSKKLEDLIARQQSAPIVNAVKSKLNAATKKMKGDDIGRQIADLSRQIADDSIKLAAFVQIQRISSTEVENATEEQQKVLATMTKRNERQ